ncbi:TPA: Dot/Icm T4SS effector LegG2 [Legionella pneumophila]|nr:Dot/Icm T4SS effector LegG2 [Legionella pneumophila]HAU0841923.1 Dot/Icm T4SS effector LegG2 [Legionella pneumophila]HAU0883483.1 Dot/Icm T4SS effector LegG2 [Legionella pneumophila]HCD9579487.1 Dot/Icm T4SS effector LegG2 [Legionella pneumophila]HDO7949751.1 Dot/Icm T4SS effector LegG2 [Legionella pneumophila]
MRNKSNLLPLIACFNNREINMPKILDSNAYREMENELNNLFEQIYKHDKKDRTAVTLQAQQFLDNLSESIRDHSRLLLTKIAREELIYFKEKKPGDSREKFQNIDKMSDYFNNLSALINFSVMQQEDPTLRVFYYDMYIQLMNFCYLKGDLFGAGAIYTGLIANNLPNSIDWKKLSSESRLIFKDCEEKFKRLFNLSTTYNAHTDLKRQFKTALIPALPSLLTVQIYTKDSYDNSVSDFERIQDKLRQLDIEHNRFLNQLQNDHSTWSKAYYDYMSNVYLPQSIFEYTTLLREYEELVTTHGGPIAKQFHEDKNSEPLVNFVESTLSENQSVLKVSPFQNERIVEMLSEIDVVKSECSSPAVFDDLSWKLREMNCTLVRAKSIGDYTSKIFANLDTPYMEENTDEDPKPVLVEELQTDDVYQLHHSGMKLMCELEQAIEDHKPKVIYHCSGEANYGFFKEARRRGRHLSPELMDIEVMDVDVMDYDENDLRDQTVMITV